MEDVREKMEDVREKMEDVRGKCKCQVFGVGALVIIFRRLTPW